MCEWYIKGQQAARRLNNAPVETSFPSAFVRAFPPAMAQPGHCLTCGTSMERDHMFPRHRAPRYMCDGCYDHAVSTATSGRCLIWGKFLPDFQAKEWRRNPRELASAFCHNECRDYWEVLAGRVLGCDYNVANTLPSGDDGAYLTLPCSQTPEPAIVLPEFNRSSYGQVRFAYAEIRYTLGR